MYSEKVCFHKELNIERWKCIQKQCKAYIKVVKLIQKELFNHNVYTIPFNDIDLIRKNIHRAKSSILSKLHASIEDYKLVSFNTIYVDGTFKCYLKQLTLFFTIYGLKESSSYIPLKHEHAFKCLSTECDKLQLKLYRKPFTRMSKRNDDSKIGIFLKYIFGLPFLTPNKLIIIFYLNLLFHLVYGLNFHIFRSNSASADFKMNTLSELTSEHGNMLLCLNNFKYYKQIILKSGKEKWRCENKKCSAVLKTINFGENRLITFQRTEHTHDASTENNLQRQVLSTGAKRKAIENNCEAPRKIIKHALDENSLDGNNSTIQVKKTYRWSLHEKRSKKVAIGGVYMRPKCCIGNTSLGLCDRTC
ncbi:hypothetical protein AGLY_004163 [Aphis glycines]|uniref:FLYWCH-type domain-containing protein n=1 Tax=Aphis glycines TaxID=307491 RepID=A0A6G0TXP4_APHGL|nr:hypothetical protein AGLY_004163 [Aphis glycines]